MKVLGKIADKLGIISKEPQDYQALLLIPYKDIVGYCHYVVNLKYEDKDLK